MGKRERETERKSEWKNKNNERMREKREWEKD